MTQWFDGSAREADEKAHRLYTDCRPFRFSPKIGELSWNIIKKWVHFTCLHVYILCLQNIPDNLFSCTCWACVVNCWSGCRWRTHCPSWSCLTRQGTASWRVTTRLQTASSSRSPVSCCRSSTETTRARSTNRASSSKSTRRLSEYACYQWAWRAPRMYLTTDAWAC